ncbi:MAG: helix-hairpin-helix domain-containing protein [Desulfobulbaceae bacterium]|nr:helix-hairpin-helix domain-containing protein [Desulfobulbaceae bacterium]
MPVSCFPFVHDFRWILLLVLSFLISTQAFNGDDEQLPRKINQCNVTTIRWREKSLIWDSTGPSGPGVYENGFQRSITYTDKQVVGVDDSPSISPRLAVFIFHPFDLNQVDAETLQIVKGVGPKLAVAIVNYRLTHGQFNSVDELLEVKGIGRAKLSALRNHLDLHSVPQ